MEGSTPLISCLMVTRGGLFPARLAIDCYRRQTWPNRELIVLCDAADPPIAAYINAIGDPSIRYVEAAQQPLGALRNASVAAACGELLAQWDDDDLYHPQRLERQAKFLLAPHSPPANFLQRWMIWWPARRLLGPSHRRIWEGSMLIRREVLPPYPPLARDEDAEMRRALRASNDLGLIDEPHLYLYVIHGGNTWDENHFERLIDKSSYYGDYEGALEQIASHLPVREYAAQLGLGSSASRKPQTHASFVFSGRHFGDRIVPLDGFRFERCVFEGTTLTYGGGAPPQMIDCTLTGVKLSLTGAAMNSFTTLGFFADAGVIRGLGRAAQ